MSDVSGQRDLMIARAKAAAMGAYAPYSGFHVGVALSFADGTRVTAANAENASYGLSLCAESVAVAKALGDRQRAASPLVAVAVFGGRIGADGVLAAAAAPVTPCGRCRQMLAELAALTGADPVVWSAGADSVVEHKLSVLLPAAFGAGALDK